MAYSGSLNSFCNDLTLKNYEDIITTTGNIAKKLNEHYYNLKQDTTSNLYIVGSVGRQTAVDGISDVDIIFNLPKSTYDKFNAYESKGQTSLLQEVKNILKDRYPRTDISGDGQVVVIAFNKYTVELVPAFLQEDNRFKYPDTHDGGSWKITDPLSEQAECSNCNDKSDGRYFDFCRLIRNWKNNIGFKFGGLLIDSLVYNHFTKNNYYKDSDKNYNSILLDLFDFLKSQDKDQTYWHAVGSNQQVQNSGDEPFVSKASEVYDILYDAINDTDNSDAIEEALSEIFGIKNETTTYVQKCFEVSSFTNTEELIENIVPVDIRFSLVIDCEVTQNGWRPFLLSEALRKKEKLRYDKQLNFFITYTDCPKPYSIYWKIRNVGPVAEQENQIRGQVLLTNSSHRKEHTRFTGPHYVECYLVKDGVCVARNRINVPIGTF